MIIRSFLFKTYFIIITALLLIFSVFILPFPYKIVSNYVKLWGVFTRFGLRLFCNIKFEARGLENLPKNRPIIVACKHQSAFETTALFYSLLPYPVYALKADLDKIPLWRALSQKAGALSVERSKGSAALKVMVTQAQKFIRQGRSIIIFPEGTRTQAQSEGRYLPGVYALTQSFNDVPLIPAAINSGIFWPSKQPIQQSGTIILEFLPALAPDLPRKAFMDQLKSDIETATRKLEQEAIS